MLGTWCLALLAPHALAAESGFVALAPIPGLTDISPTALVQSDSLANFFNNLYKYLIGVAAILAIIEIIWGGVEISAQDSVTKNAAGKARIWNALWGLLLVLSPAIVFSIINPSILNLSIGLRPLDMPATVPIVRRDGTSTTTISNAAQTGRESHGGQLIGAPFMINVADISPNQRISILDQKQEQCTRDSGGRGIILPENFRNDTGFGGNIAYVCQTCPAGTTVRLVLRGHNNLGTNARGARGSCQQN